MPRAGEWERGLGGVVVGGVMVGCSMGFCSVTLPSVSGLCTGISIVLVTFGTEIFETGEVKEQGGPDSATFTAEHPENPVELPHHWKRVLTARARPSAFLVSSLPPMPLLLPFRDLGRSA